MCLHFLNLQASAECTCLNFQHFLGCIFRPALDSVVLLTTKNGFCISAKKTFELHFRLQQTYFFSNVRRNKKDFWLKLKKDNIRRIRFIFCLFWLFVGGHRYDTGRREMMGWSPWEMFRSHLGLSWKLFYLKFATFPFLRHQEHSFHFGIPLLWRKVVWEVVFWCLGFWGVACAGSPRHTTQCRFGNPHWLQVSQGTWLGVANPIFSQAISAAFLSFWLFHHGWLFLFIIIILFWGRSLWSWARPQTHNSWLLIPHRSDGLSSWSSSSYRLVIAWSCNNLHHWIHINGLVWVVPPHLLLSLALKLSCPRS